MRQVEGGCRDQRISDSNFKSAGVSVMGQPGPDPASNLQVWGTYAVRAERRAEAETHLKMQSFGGMWLFAIVFRKNSCRVSDAKSLRRFPIL